MKYVDVARSPGSALSVFTSSERRADQLKINEIGQVGKSVTKIEMDAREVGQLVKKIEMGDPKVGNLVNKDEMGKLGVVGKSV